MEEVEVRPHFTGFLQLSDVDLVIVVFHVAQQELREIRIVLLRLLKFLFIESPQSRLVPPNSSFDHLSSENRIPLDGGTPCWLLN